MTAAERRKAIGRYAAGPARLRAALRRVPRAALHWRPAPGEWSAHEVIHHCADSESNAHLRLRYLLAEQDPLIVGYDQAEWARALEYARRPLGAGPGDGDRRARQHRAPAPRAPRGGLEPERAAYRDGQRTPWRAGSASTPSTWRFTPARSRRTWRRGASSAGRGSPDGAATRWWRRRASSDPLGAAHVPEKWDVLARAPTPPSLARPVPIGYKKAPDGISRRPQTRGRSASRKGWPPSPRRRPRRLLRPARAVLRGARGARAAPDRRVRPRVHRLHPRLRSARARPCASRRRGGRRAPARQGHDLLPAQRADPGAGGRDLSRPAVRRAGALHGVGQRGHLLRAAGRARVPGTREDPQVRGRLPRDARLLAHERGAARAQGVPGADAGLRRHPPRDTGARPDRAVQRPRRDRGDPGRASRGPRRRHHGAVPAADLAGQGLSPGRARDHPAVTGCR